MTRIKFIGYDLSLSVRPLPPVCTEYHRIHGCRVLPGRFQKAPLLCLRQIYEKFFIVHPVPEKTVVPKTDL